MATETSETPPNRVTRELADSAVGSRPVTGPDSSGQVHPGSQPRLADGTQSFMAPAMSPGNLYASRVLAARIKVNSARHAAPAPKRQTGPWTPQAVSNAAEAKPNEVEAAASVPAWPRPVDATMEYQAVEAMARETAPVAFEMKLPRAMVKPTGLVDDGKTRPITPPPDMPLRLPPRVVDAPPASQRATQIQSPDVIPPRAARAIDALVPSEPAIEDHRFEQAVALVLFAAALYLVYLITA